MQYKFSTVIGGIAFGVLLILASHVMAVAQSTVSRTSADDEWRMRQVLAEKNRSYEVSRNGTAVHYDLGVPRNAKELSKFNGIASKLKKSTEELVKEFNYKSNWFPIRVNVLPLTFKKFLLAKIISNNLEATRPDITTDVLLWGLVRRQSYSRTMRDSGLSIEEAKAVEKSARQEMKESKR